MELSRHKKKPSVLLFDVNETLLDIAPLKRAVNQRLGDDKAATLWFTTMLQYSLVMTVGDRYAPFSEVGAAALRMVARNHGVELTAEEAKQTLAPMRTLPPHADARPALEALGRAGLRLAALTNSPQDGAEAQLKSAGLADCFERILSVESSRKYKPHRAVYEWAAAEMGAAPDDCMLVAAHGWDVAGAKWAGLQTAFIARPGQQLFPLGDAPDIEADDLHAFAGRLT